MYNRDEVRAQNEYRRAQWPRSILWATAAIAGAPVLSYNLWTILDPLIHFNADPIGLFVPLVLGTIALWKALSPTWVKVLVVPSYFVIMGSCLFNLLFAWACAHGRGCL